MTLKAGEPITITAIQSDGYLIKRGDMPPVKIPKENVIAPKIEVTPPITTLASPTNNPYLESIPQNSAEAIYTLPTSTPTPVPNVDAPKITIADIDPAIQVFVTVKRNITYKQLQGKIIPEGTSIPLVAIQNQISSNAPPEGIPVAEINGKFVYNRYIVSFDNKKLDLGGGDLTQESFTKALNKIKGHLLPEREPKPEELPTWMP